MRPQFLVQLLLCVLLASALSACDSDDSGGGNDSQGQEEPKDEKKDKPPTPNPGPIDVNPDYVLKPNAWMEIQSCARQSKHRVGLEVWSQVGGAYFMTCWNKAQPLSEPDIGPKFEKLFIEKYRSI